MELNKIFGLEEYEDAYNFAVKNKFLIEEIESDCGKRKFKIIERPKLSEEELLEGLRSQREFECFSVINRGALWYENLSVEQYLDLQRWYKEWLDVTATKNIPARPAWLK